MNVIRRKLRSDKGFSLIEIAIAMTFVSLFAGVILQSFKIYSHNKHRIENRSKHNDITSAIASFVATQGRYPCPADPQLNPGDVNFGIELLGATGCDVDATLPSAIPQLDPVTGLPVVNPIVAFGAVPVSTLSLPHGHVYDAFRTKLTYAVSIQAASRPPVFNAPPLIVDHLVYDNDSTLPPVVGQTNTEFVVISHGKDRKGAFINNAITIACGTTAVDSENCDFDQVFTDREYASHFNINNANHTDDLISFTLARAESTRWYLEQNTVDTGGGGTQTNGVNIIVRNPNTSVAIGTNTPAADARVQVEQGNVTVQGGNVVVNDAQITSERDMQARNLNANTGKTSAPAYFYNP
jgi:type II secretory pathway pseudopilin PulG